MSQKTPSLNAVVTKHNFLLPKLAKMGLSELRLLTFCLAHYDSRPEKRETPVDGDYIPQEFFRFTATVQDLLNIFPGMGKQTAYAVVRQAVKGINSKPFEDTFTLPNGKTESVLLYWFSGFRYTHEEGRFTFSLSQDIVNLVLSQDGNFTRFRLKHVYQFKAALTWKLYEVLKQWVVAGRWSVNLDELRMVLGVPGKYPAWRDLKKRLLDNPIKEINDLSDIVVKYEKKKRVRAVDGVVFFITTKEAEAKENDPSIVANIGDTNRDIRLLMSVGLNQTNAELLSRLATDANKDLSVFLDRVVARYEAKMDDKPSKQAYVYKALYNEFAPSLFDDLDAPAKKVDLGFKPMVKAGIDATQKAKSQEYNKYAKEIFVCQHFKAREAEGFVCPDIKPRTKKCSICTELTKRFNTI